MQLDVAEMHTDDMQEDLPDVADKSETPWDSPSSLSSPIITQRLVKIWFDYYHPWFPILHQPTLLSILDSTSRMHNIPYCAIFKAISSVTVAQKLQHPSEIPDDFQEQHRKAAHDLRDQVLIWAMDNLSLQSLQALLIIAVGDWGQGNISRCWNVIAVCRRWVGMSTSSNGN